MSTLDLYRNVPGRWCAVLAIVTLCAHGLADYELTPRRNGQLAASIAKGTSITLDLELASTSDPVDVHNSCIFRLVFTQGAPPYQPGLVYESYAWSAPYLDGLPYDFSIPLIDELPVVIDEAVLEGLAYPPDLADVELTNVLVEEVFDVGPLATVTLHAPIDLEFTGIVYIAAVPDTFALGFEEIPAFSGPAFELTVNPACDEDIAGSDGLVELQDLLLVISSWGPCPGSGDCVADVNRDGEVGYSDLIQVLSSWGTCP